MVAYINTVLPSSTTIDIPSQAQLRRMSTILRPSEIVELQLFHPPPIKYPSSDEIYTKIQQAKGELRDRIWRMAMKNRFRTSPPATSTNPKFHKFLRLQIEIREQIWTDVRDGAGLRLYKWPPTQSNRVRKPPSILSVCSHSRRIGKEALVYCDGTWVNVDTTLFYVKLDYIFSVDWKLRVDYIQELWVVFAVRFWRAWNELQKENAYFYGTKPGHRLKRFAVSWIDWQWEIHLSHPTGRPFFPKTFEEVLKSYFPGLKELILILEERIVDQCGALYKDERSLTEDDLLDPTLAERVSFPTDMENSIPKKLKLNPKAFGIFKKLLQVS
ncbi:uncharacterized protein LY89DRAFT_772325 [Mollisia scopiformis]|uniref:2EXR domain-containing protein n=1 Tax=Mollisia scopiformis TaxID=149040 RepID=A0A194XI12_MOLSC|nr:uncharacterized protein LY89DRAFT_772325 [Mollisia scopiformis]KUJ19776.1 hypothetical protein LY89DRAFT_772325 [Mollisia scopiformis]